MNREMLRALHEVMAPLRRKLALVASRAVLSLVRDGTGMQGVQVQALDGEVIDAEHMQPGGLTHRAIGGAEGVLLSIGGARDDGVVIAVSNRGNRPKNLAAGDTAVYSASETPARIYVRANGDIEVQCGAGRSINLSASGAPAESFLKGDAFVNAIDTFLTQLDIFIKLPAPTAPQLSAYETASTAFRAAIAAAKSTVIKGE